VQKRRPAIRTHKDKATPKCEIVPIWNKRVSAGSQSGSHQRQRETNIYKRECVRDKLLQMQKAARINSAQGRRNYWSSPALRQIKDPRSFSKSALSSALTGNVHLSVANAEETNNYRSPWGHTKKPLEERRQRPEMRAGNLGNPLTINSERRKKYWLFRAQWILQYAHTYIFFIFTWY